MSEDGPRVYRVAELNRRVRLRLEQWGEVWVEGEIADASRAASGHVYFTLADSREPAQIRVVMFRGDARFARAKLEDGEHVRLLGRLSLFEPRGTFQLLARVARLAG
ncbi:MAG: exodeoxyribonuclease VII large subunit, partial [Sandaracinaceae bacterium]|nr:exodeoxyribonuclease VII large subunit [Sandaracinaceae bacterium]